MLDSGILTGKKENRGVRDGFQCPKKSILWYSEAKAEIKLEAIYSWFQGLSKCL